MPELPEVETVRRGLESKVIGKKIASTEILWSRIIENDSVEFTNSIIGQEIVSVSRRGKFLIFHLSNSDLISHLRMEGKFEYYEKPTDVSKHTHVILHFSDQSQLRYLDVRKFGRMKLVEKGQALSEKNLASLGPEPIAKDFDLKEFQKALKMKHKAIKPVLLEQKLVVGLGNIYVDEVLWLAKIHPLTLADKLTKKQTEVLHEAIIDIMARSIAAGGSTIRTYLNALGDAGNFQKELKVYGQQNQPCARCGTIISKIKVAGRGTHFCPKCQKVRLE